jgi:hypothetical protein
MEMIMGYEEECDLQDKIWVAVHDLVDKMLEGVPLESDENIRMRLTETFRFWHRER